MSATGKSAVSAIVLAAGMSRRMGSPKQLLQAGDRTLLDLTLENVRNSRVGEIILVLGFAADEIQRKIAASGLRVVVNEAYQEGMASSLRAGISARDPQAQAALIVLADQPCVRPATLDALIAHHDRSRAQIVIPTFKGFRGNPVLLDRSIFPEVMAIAGDVGCRAIFGGHTENIHKVEVDDVGILLDVDTAGDLEKVSQAQVESSENRIAALPDLESRAHAQDEPSQPELIVIGRDALARALLQLAKTMGFSTIVVDPLLGVDDFPEADRALHRLDFSLLPGQRTRFFVVASRGQFDEDAVELALQTSAVYVGLVANQKRAQEIRAGVERKGISGEQAAKLHAPAGLALGAESPEEVALSIMAEIVAVRRKHGSE